MAAQGGQNITRNQRRQHLSHGSDATQGRKGVVAQNGQGAAVGLVHGGQQGREGLIEPAVPTAHGGIAGQGARQPCVQCQCQRHGVQQRHVGTLAQLRAGPVRGVADEGKAGLIGGGKAAVAVTGDGHVRGLGQMCQIGGDGGPELADLRLPACEIHRGPVVKVGLGQGPEHGGPGDILARQPPDGHDPRHARGLVIALGQLVGWQGTIGGPGDRGPDRAEGQRPRPER